MSTAQPQMTKTKFFKVQGNICEKQKINVNNTDTNDKNLRIFRTKKYF